MTSDCPVKAAFLVEADLACVSPCQIETGFHQLIRPADEDYLCIFLVIFIASGF